jgi:GNAT superfamily N-acetyltransferase
MVIRKAELKDLESLANFQVKMAMETEGLSLSKATVLKGIEHLFEQPQKGEYWGVYFENKIIACTLTIPEWSDWRNGTVLWIHSVYVEQEYRKRGLFRLLYEHLKTMVAEDSALLGIRLYVDKTNVSAQKVYKSLGMNGEHYQLFEWLKN